MERGDNGVLRLILPPGMELDGFPEDITLTACAESIEEVELTTVGAHRPQNGDGAGEQSQVRATARSAPS